MSDGWWALLMVLVTLLFGFVSFIEGSKYGRQLEHELTGEGGSNG